MAASSVSANSQGVIETIPGKGCFLKDSNARFTKQVRQKLLIKEVDEAVVTAHHLQVDRDSFLELVNERLDFFERKISASAKNK